MYNLAYVTTNPGENKDETQVVGLHLWSGPRHCVFPAFHDITLAF